MPGLFFDILQHTDRRRRYQHGQSGTAGKSLPTGKSNPAGDFAAITNPSVLGILYPPHLNL